MPGLSLVFPENRAGNLNVRPWIRSQSEQVPK